MRTYKALLQLNRQIKFRMLRDCSLRQLYCQTLHLIFIFIIVCFSIQISTGPALAQAYPDNTSIESLKSSAASDRAYADKLLEQAKQWRELAGEAERNARGSKDPRDKKRWEEDADARNEHARELEERAAELIKGAEQKEARVRELPQQNESMDAEVTTHEGTGSDQQGDIEKKPSKDKIELEDVMGVWRDTEDHEPFVITSEDPGFEAYKNKLKLHTMKRIWKGRYESFDEGDIRRVESARIVFHYKPKAEEMNPEVPLWARKAVEGELEWKLELNEDDQETCGGPRRLDGKWYPGEISWNEDERSAWASESDESREFTLESAKGSLRYGIETKPKVIVRVQGQETNPAIYPVTYMIRGQDFYIEVLLPKSLAEKSGASINAKIESLGSGDSVEVTLQTTPARLKRETVLYTNYNAVRFSRKIELETSPSILDIDLVNDEFVKISYAGAFQQFRILDSWVQRGIRRRLDAFNQLREMYTTILQRADVPNEIKEVYHNFIQRIKNAEAIISSDKIHDYQRYAAAKKYLDFVQTAKGEYKTRGLIFKTKKDIENELADPGAPFAATVNIHPDKRIGNGIYEGVFWTTGYEKHYATKTVNDAKKDYRRQAIEELQLAATFAMYDGIMVISNVGDIYTYFSGKDIFGKDVSESDAMFAGLRTVFGALLLGSGSAYVADLSSSSNRIIRTGNRIKYETKIKFASKPTKKPDSVSQGQFQKLLSQHKARPGSPNQTPPTAHSQPIIIRPAPPAPQPLPVLTERPITMTEVNIKNRYSENTEFANINEPQSRHFQENLQLCNQQSVLEAYEAKTGEYISMIDSYLLLKNMDYISPSHSAYRVGLHDIDVVNLVDATGGIVIRDIDTGAFNFIEVDLRRFDALMQRGFVVKNILQIRSTRRQMGHDSYPLHAVTIKRLIKNRSGDIEEVHFFDPAYGKTLKMPACDYLNLLAPANIYPNTMYIKWD
jgi:hypothetical protein